MISFADCLKSYRQWQRLALIACAMLLSAASAVSIYSLSANGSAQYKAILTKQLFFMVFGLSLCLVMSRLNYLRLVRYSIIAFIVIVAALLYLLVLGRPIRGSRAWIQLGGFSIQPAEFLKVALVPALAWFIRFRFSAGARLGIITLLVIPQAAMIALQPDLGMASLILIFYLIILLSYAVKNVSHATILALTLAAISAIIYGFVLKDYHRQRIAEFLSQKEGSNLQQFNAVKLVAYGGFSGNGLSDLSMYNPLYVPDRHNDFLFSCIGEGFGFIGCAVIITAFFMIIYTLISLSEEITDVVAKRIIYFTALYLGLQGSINLAVNLGLLPVIGINMPFFGYGGSSTISCYMLLGIVLSILRKPVYSFATPQ